MPRDATRQVSANNYIGTQRAVRCSERKQQECYIENYTQFNSIQYSSMSVRALCSTISQKTRKPYIINNHLAIKCNAISCTRETKKNTHFKVQTHARDDGTICAQPKRRERQPELAKESLNESRPFRSDPNRSDMRLLST